jgi:hypothetical protein
MKYKIFETFAAGICVSSLSFEIIRIQKMAYARSLSNRSKTCYDSKGSEAKAYIRKYLRVARGIWERRHFHCDFGVKLSGNRSLHDYNFASSGHIALKQSRRIAVYDCLVGPSFLLLTLDICKSGKHWCLVGYTRGGRVHTASKKYYHDCIRSLIFRSMHSILSHLLCQWKLKVYTLYISNIYIFSCLWFYWFIYILQAVNILKDSYFFEHQIVSQQKVTYLL